MNIEELLRMIIEIIQKKIDELSEMLEKITDTLIESLPGQD